MLIQKPVLSDSILACELLPTDFCNTICQEETFPALTKTEDI